MATYQDVVKAQGAVAAWAFAEASGTVFAPYIGGTSLAGTGTFAYQQAGPFAASFGLRINVGGKLALAFLASLPATVSYECFFKLTSPPASAQYLVYIGAATTNGGGYYISTGNGHVHIFIAVGNDFDTGVTWPNDGAFHLFHAVQEGSSISQSLYIDGVLVWRGLTRTPTAPTPNTTFIGGENGSAALVQTTVAMLAFYPRTLTPLQVANSQLAITNPDAALAAANYSTSNILDLILASVRKSY